MLKTVEEVKAAFLALPIPEGVTVVDTEFFMSWNRAPMYVAMYHDSRWNEYRVVSSSEGRVDSEVTCLYKDIGRASLGMAKTVDELMGWVS